LPGVNGSPRADLGRYDPGMQNSDDNQDGHGHESHGQQAHGQHAHGNRRVIAVGTGGIYLLEVLGLLLITIATIVAGAQEVQRMVAEAQVTLGDLLLLFIYLEVLTMVGIYLSSGALPVRMPLYIAIVALARHLILDMKSMSQWTLIATASAVLILALAVLVLRYGHARFPYGASEDGRDMRDG
jgi:protein PsiE